MNILVICWIVFQLLSSVSGFYRRIRLYGEGKDWEFKIEHKSLPLITALYFIDVIVLAYLI